VVGVSMPEYNIKLDDVLTSFHYDSDDGVLYRIRKSGLKPVGSKDKKGYLKAKFKGSYVRIHRLIWFFNYGEFPSGQIDHINGNRADNRLCNLRVVNNSDNQRNQKINVKNSTGMSGVSWHTRDRKWYVNIGDNGKKVHIGLFCDIFDAFCARKSAENKYGYHENHGRRIN
jgi:hypothetical protein